MSIITHWIGAYMNLDGLNDCQKRAVKRTEGPLLIIAVLERQEFLLTG